jgi:putative DNA primase/helicase
MLKTPALQEVIRPIVVLELAAKEKFEKECAAYEVKCLVAKAAKKVTEGKMKEALKKGDTAESVAADFADAVEPVAPPTRCRYMTNDVTIEKLGELLNENPNGIFQVRDELMGLLRGTEKDGHEQDRAFLLEAWNGKGRFTYDRIGRGTIDIDNVCLSLLGGIQPDP